MSRRNFILFSIVLGIVVVISLFLFKYYASNNQSKNPITESINFLSDFVPFGKSTNTENKETETPANISQKTEEIMENSGKLKKISSFEVAGYGLFTKERVTETQNNIVTEDNMEKKENSIQNEFSPAVRYVNKATGNIYQTFLDKIEERKFSLTSIPKIYEAFFGNNGQSVIMRYLKNDNNTIETYVGNLPKEFLGADSTGNEEVKGSFLPEGISDVSVSKDSSKIFYLFKTGESSTGISYDLATGAKTQIFNSPFTEWLSSWGTNNQINVSTKPSAYYEGYAYTIDLNKKDFNKSISEVKGLTIIGSPEGKSLLYTDNTLNLKIFDLSSKTSISLGIKTLPEKCIWTISNMIYCAVPEYIPNEDYPDSWYRGETHFKDQIWKIDPESGNTTLIADLYSLSNKEIDAIKLDIDKDNKHLLFIDKNESYLWALSLD